MNQNTAKKELIRKYAIYIVLFMIFVFKMFFYSNQGFSIPDSRAQLSYLIYMEKNSDRFIPDFSDIIMYGSASRGEVDGKEITIMRPQTSTCYLGHPPLYYKMMQLCDTIEVGAEGIAYIDTNKLVNCNVFLTAITMVIILLTGYKLIEKNGGSWYLHLLFAAIATTLPLYGYIGSGANNDNLCNLGLAIFWMGLVSYLENHYSYKTFWLVGLGITICMFSKLTAGLIVVIVTVIMILTDIIKTKKLGIICNKYFLTTLPLYVMVLVYFLIIYAEYGFFQPSYGRVVSLDEFMDSSFYIAEENRVVLTFSEVLVYFFKGMWQTWCGTYNSSYMLSRDGLNSVPFAVVWILFVGCMIGEIVTFIKNKGKENVIIHAAFGVAIIFTILYQFRGYYMGYLGRGYLGGYQARYYMPCIPIIAMGATQAVIALKQKYSVVMDKGGKYLVAILAFSLVYLDFFYYVLNIYVIK